jgi:hypothetical protein
LGVVPLIRRTLSIKTEYYKKSRKREAILW